MSEEEKLLNDLKDYLNYLKGKNLMTSFRFNIVDLLENSISLIENQQKEIEDLKTNYKRLQNTEAVHHIYIIKDKIREKIKEIESRRIEDGKCELAIYGFQRDAKIEVLQELLEE